MSESGRKGGKLHDLLLEDRELVSDLLAGAPVDAAREQLRKLIATPVFEELNKRSLIARFLKQRIREADYIFRWGGDEFLVLLTCTAGEAARKAAAIKAAFDTAPEAVDLPPGLGLSVGWIEVPPGTADLMPAVSEADRRMYVDKGRR